MKLLVYGKLMLPETMNAMFPDARYLGMGRIPGHTIEFYRQSAPAHEEGASLPVAAYELSEYDRAQFDQCMGYPEVMRHAPHKADMADGTQLEGMLYILNSAYMKPFPYSEESFRQICDTYEKLGLHDEIASVLEPAFRRNRERAAKKD